MSLVWALLIGMAAYRLWRLVGADSITAGFREAIEGVPWLWEWVNCHWCSGTWIAFGVTWAADWAVGIEAPVLVGLAAAAVVGIARRWAE